MNNAIVRIISVEIYNFKNVKHGFLSFENPRKSFSASILGLYGQNGSGKTALIDSIRLLKYALTGQVIPASFSDYINVDSDHSTIIFLIEILLPNNKGKYTVTYEFSIKKSVDETTQNTESLTVISSETKTVIFNEKISYSFASDDKAAKKQVLLDTNTDSVFAPAVKYSILVGDSLGTKTSLLTAKKYVSLTSRSFLFSNELLKEIRSNCKDSFYLTIIESLIQYGNFELFIIDTSNSGLITLNTLPLSFKYEEKGTTSLGSIALNLNGTVLIPKEAFHVSKSIISSMNIVLNAIVPGLKIDIVDIGTELLKDGSTGIRAQMISLKNGKTIPLKYESEGIKKIISILQLLIVVFNNSAITVAIDELDSGIFEYLLGELLRIISEKGKGQLIFTSHNLRPLETLDRGFIAFTTANPDNRYIRLSNVKSNNNLRAFYFRDIVLGEQNEVTYDPTNNYEIALAFREAGDYSGS